MRLDSSACYFKSSSDDSSEVNCESQCSPASELAHRERFYTTPLPGDVSQEVLAFLSWCREETFSNVIDIIYCTAKLKGDLDQHFL